MIPSQAIGRIVRSGTPKPTIEVFDLTRGIPTPAEILAHKRAAAKAAKASLRRNLRMRRALQACLDLEREVHDSLTVGERVTVTATMGDDLRYAVHVLSRAPDSPTARAIASKEARALAARAAEAATSRRARRRLGPHKVRIDLEGAIPSATARAIEGPRAIERARASAAWLRRALKLNADRLLARRIKAWHGSEDP